MGPCPSPTHSQSSSLRGVFGTGPWGGETRGVFVTGTWGGETGGVFVTGTWGGATGVFIDSAQLLELINDPLSIL